MSDAKKELFNFDFSIFFPSSGKVSVLLNVFTSLVICGIWNPMAYYNTLVLALNIFWNILVLKLFT